MNFSESAYRKKYQYFEKMYEANQKTFRTNDEYLESLRKEKLELEKEKVQYRDERAAFNKRVREFARLDARLDNLEAVLQENGQDHFSPVAVSGYSSDNDLLVCLSDLHIGAAYDSIFGEYDSDIARERLQKYLAYIIEIKQLHHSESCYVALLGDMVSGSIHRTIQVSNRENVIEQVQLACELVAEFVYGLSKHFKKVYVSNVNGNHSRLDRKEDAVKDERLDQFIPWYLENTLKHISNISIEESYESTINVIEIRKRTYLQVHGDYDAFSKNGISNLVLLLGHKPYACLFGHYHTSGMDEISGIKLIKSGSLGGSGDDYTIQKRLSGKPSQMVCVCKDSGVMAYYPVELNAA